VSAVLRILTAPPPVSSAGSLAGGRFRPSYHHGVDPVLRALAGAATSGLMPPDGPILLAVSGGADSMALLRGCLELAPKTGWRLTVGHVHHGLRGREADRDLAFAKEHALRAGLPFLFRRRDAAGEARALGLSPEAAARHVRYAALQEMAREVAASRIAVAHQGNDVAECVLLARGRRAGISALAGPRERRADGVVRPLLAVTRSEVVAFLESRGVGYRRDASNGDLSLPRNRARRELAAGRTVAVEELLREAASLAGLRARLDREFEERVRPRLHSGPGVTLADAAFLASCPRELARRALTEAAGPFAASGRAPLTGPEREQILDRLASGRDFRFEAGRRIRFERRGPLLRVALRPDSRFARSARVLGFSRAPGHKTDGRAEL
jgi:tRNA(Ile)-lysidine synthetase-like protein